MLYQKRCYIIVGLLWRLEYLVTLFWVHSKKKTSNQKRKRNVAHVSVTSGHVVHDGLLCDFMCLYGKYGKFKSDQ